MKIRHLLALAGIVSASASFAQMSTTFVIKDLLTTPSYTDSNISQTFAGTGFIGMYSNSYTHLFGLEQANFSKTALQVDISALAGADILAAVLSFDLRDGEGGVQTVTLTSYTSNGVLGHFWNAPDTLGQVSYNSPGLSSNLVDVTALLANAVSADQSWFGLHLQGSSLYHYTYTYAGSGDTDDEANVRLTVRYNPGEAGAVPEPSTYGLIGAALLAGLVAWKRFRR